MSELFAEFRKLIFEKCLEKYFAVFPKSFAYVLIQNDLPEPQREGSTSFCRTRFAEPLFADLFMPKLFLPNDCFAETLFDNGLFCRLSFCRQIALPTDPALPDLATYLSLSLIIKDPLSDSLASENRFFTCICYVARSAHHL